jgi:hypothetical protein
VNGVIARERLTHKSMATPYMALAVTSLAAAGIHFGVMADHFDEYFLFGLFFSVVAWLQALWAIGLAVAPGRFLLAAGLVGNLSIVVIWTVSRTTGLPIGPDAGTAEAVGFSDVLSTVLEVLIVAGCALLLTSRRQRGFPAGPVGMGGVLVLTVLLAGITTAALATGVEHGDDHGAHDAGAVGSEPEITLVDLGAGRELQAFVDSPAGGEPQVHFTFFAEDGTELPISSLVAEGVSPSGSPLDLAPERFGAGHFVSSADLEHGEWEVDITATTDGESLSGTFEIHVEE